MSSNSSSSCHKHMPPKVVIVKPNSTALNYDSTSGSKKEDQLLKDLGLVLLQNNTYISLNFSGTSVAVIAMNHSIPPIPDQFLPRWTCLIDGLPISEITSLIPVSNSSAPQNTTKIPSDNKARVCEANRLPSGPHNLTVQVDTPSLPGYFHSIRYIPIDETSVKDAILRIDSSDRSVIFFNETCWDNHKNGPLQSKCPDSMMNITFYGQSLEWVGSSKIPSKIKLTLDGEDHPLKHHDSDNSGSTFTLDNLDPDYHNLTVLTTNEPLTLDHLLVTVGKPTTVQLADNSTPNTPPPSSTPIRSSISPAAVIGSVIGGIVGLILCGLIVYLVTRYIRGRQRRNNWKDSALPPTILYPASRVSSRSSFSREVVTGDVEYNPEAQKKLESASMTSVTSPPTAIIIHADSGLRFPFRASEVPPYYARV